MNKRYFERKFRKNLRICISAFISFPLFFGIEKIILSELAKCCFSKSCKDKRTLIKFRKAIKESLVQVKKKQSQIIIDFIDNIFLSFSFSMIKNISKYSLVDSKPFEDEFSLENRNISEITNTFMEIFNDFIHKDNELNEYCSKEKINFLIEENNHIIKMYELEKEYTEKFNLSNLSNSEINILESFSLLFYTSNFLLPIEQCEDWLIQDSQLLTNVEVTNNIFDDLCKKGWLEKYKCRNIQQDPDTKSNIVITNEKQYNYVMDLFTKGQRKHDCKMNVYYGMNPYLSDFIFYKLRPKIENHLFFVDSIRKIIKGEVWLIFSPNDHYFFYIAEAICSRFHYISQFHITTLDMMWSLAGGFNYLGNYEKSLDWYGALLYLAVQLKDEEKEKRLRKTIDMVENRKLGIYEENTIIINTHSGKQLIHDSEEFEKIYEKIEL